MDWHSDTIFYVALGLEIESLKHMSVSRATFGIIDNGQILPQLLLRGKPHCCHITVPDFLLRFVQQKENRLVVHLAPVVA